MKMKFGNFRFVSAFAGIEAKIANHFEGRFRDMDDEFLNEIQSGNGFRDRLIILMAGVMKRDGLTIITVNTGGGNRRTAKIAANIFNQGMRVHVLTWSMNIKAVGMSLID